ncbi:MAG TPA: hypothetical protein VKU84_13305 [Stellaceae bacterium]|nr:hypothetical protein [Stellaceae bacterium]
MSYALEFYSLSWEALRTALTGRKPELVRRIQERQWDKLIASDGLGEAGDRREQTSLRDAGPVFTDALDEIAEAMKREPTPDRDPPELGDRAALVFAAFVRELGTQVGSISHDASEAQEPELDVVFRETFLDGVAGGCFGDHQLGEKLAARPVLGLFHLDFLGWGGLGAAELEALLPKYALTDAVKRDRDWSDCRGYAETWLPVLLQSLRAAAAAKRDLVSLYLTGRHHYASFGEELRDVRRDAFGT